MKMFDEMFERAAAAERTAATANAVCSCGGATTEITVREQIPFGSDGVMIEVDVPAISCGDCGRIRTDRRADAVRHAAVCEHQGLLTPERIKAIRKDRGMSRQEFSEAYCIPPASMERWENGKLLQNRSMDKFLRAIEDPLSLSLPKPVKPAVVPSASVGADLRINGNVVWANFPALRDASEKERADAAKRESLFNLRRSG